MSQENVEIVRKGIDAWSRGDRDEWLAYLAPQAEWHTSGLFADEGVYRGRAGLKRYWAEVREDIEELSASVLEIRAIGDRVFVAATVTGRGKRSKAGIEGPAWFVMTLRDGLVVRLKSYLAPEQALEAAGLSE